MNQKLTGHWLLLRAGRLRLLVPQADVGAAEFLECEPQAGAQAGVFEVTIAGEGQQVVFPSEKLRPLHSVPARRYVLTQLLAAEVANMWFAWDEVRVLVLADLDAHNLPRAVCEGGALPARRYVELAGELALCSTAADVVTYLCAHLETCE